MREKAMLGTAEKDWLATGLLLTGVGLAILATFLPVIQVAGQSGDLTMTTWELLPWFAKLKFVALILLMAAAFLPGLHKWRLPVAAVAVIMVFLPAISAFLSSLHAWGTLRADLARLSGQRSLLINPGIANLVLVAAAMMVSYAVWRIETLGRRDDPHQDMAEA
jgi:hypothetical protein